MPVIGSMIASLKTAEFAAEVASRLGRSRSKIAARESPQREESAPWRLGDQYEFGEITPWLRQD